MNRLHYKVQKGVQYGKRVHGWITISGFGVMPLWGNALLEMYVKCKIL